jgi:hypothetical protein
MLKFDRTEEWIEEKKEGCGQLFGIFCLLAEEVELLKGCGFSGPRTGTIQDFSDFQLQGIQGKRLLEKGRSWLQDSVLDNGIVRISGHVQNLHLGK